MSLHIPKLFKSPLALASAALVLHLGAATAADSNGDIQQQMRDLLTGNTNAHSASQPRPRQAAERTPAKDSQEFAKQLLLGAAAFRVRDADPIKHSGAAGTPGKTAPQQHLAHVDMQAQVRKLLLGQSHASDAS